MFERALHGSNIAAAFAMAAAAADLTIAAVAATTITADLWGVAIYKSTDNPGHELTALDIQDGDEDGVEQAKVTLTTAAEQHTQDSCSLEWAKMQCNLGKVAVAFSTRPPAFFADITNRRDALS